MFQKCRMANEPPFSLQEDIAIQQSLDLLSQSLTNRRMCFFQFPCCRDLRSFPVSPVPDCFLRMDMDKALALET